MTFKETGTKLIHNKFSFKLIQRRCITVLSSLGYGIILKFLSYPTVKLKEMDNLSLVREIAAEHKNEFFLLL